jgi:hypothetical protein
MAARNKLSQRTSHSPRLRAVPSPLAVRSRRKFLRFFPKGFRDPKYIAWERGYKQNAHEEWNQLLSRAGFTRLLRAHEFKKIASRALGIESRTNLLFSFEKMALRDAVKLDEGARTFAVGLYEFLHGAGDPERRFERWRDVVGQLPRKQSRVLNWPVLTVFGFIAQPNQHIFLKPKVTRAAAREYGYEFPYQSRPSWATYATFLKFANAVRRDLADFEPQDMIDLQSFLWVLGSDEYAE